MPMAQRLSPAWPLPPSMDGRRLARELARTTLVIVSALFVAGAAVSARLHLRIFRHGGGFAVGEVLEQGLEVVAWFGFFVLAAAALSAGFARSWRPRRGRRLATTGTTFAIAFALFELVFWVLDGLAVLYLAAGSLAYGLTSAGPVRPSVQEGEGVSSPDPTDAKVASRRLLPSES
jgi:hypothetical protein